jgi:hypothetical protein
MRTDVKKDALDNQKALVELFARHQPRIVEALDNKTRETALTQAIEVYNNTSQAKEDDLDWLAVGEAIYQTVSKTPALRKDLIGNDEAFGKTMGVFDTVTTGSPPATPEELDIHENAIKNAMKKFDQEPPTPSASDQPSKISQLFTRLLGGNVDVP